MSGWIQGENGNLYKNIWRKDLKESVHKYPSSPLFCFEIWISLWCRSPFPFIYAYAGTFEFIRYRFLKSPSSFFSCLSSFISSLLGTIFVFGPIRNDSIISVSAIQYTWDIYHTYMLPFFSSFSYNLRILERSILFFVLASTFPNESRGMSHYDLNCIYLDCIFLFHFSYPFLSP